MKLFNRGNRADFNSAPNKVCFHSLSSLNVNFKLIMKIALICTMGALILKMTRCKLKFKQEKSKCGTALSSMILLFGNCIMKRFLVFP